MSALSASNISGFHATDRTPLVSGTSTPVPGASEFTTLVPLGHTLFDISNMRIPIETTLATIPKNAPNKTELADAVRASITECQELLYGVTQVKVITKAHCDDLFRLLQDVHAHLQDRDIYGKRAQIKGKVRAIFYRPASPPPTYHLQIREAFNALKSSLPHPVMVAPQSTTIDTHPAQAVIDVNPQNETVHSSLAPEVANQLATLEAPPSVQGPIAPPLHSLLHTSALAAPQSNSGHSHPPPAVAEAKFQGALAASAVTLPVIPQPVLPMRESPLTQPAEKIRPKLAATTAPKKDPLWSTVTDTVEGGLRLLSTLTDFIPGPAGPIVKLMAGTGLTIIETLQGMKENREEALNLGRYIGALIQTVGRFLEPPEDGTTESCDAETTKQLESFLEALKALETSLAEFKAQGRFKRGVSHKTNKDDLAKWNDSIYSAFTTLQTHLSLGSIRLLTKMNASNALQERDRLIGRLGDGDIGATEKASNAADLMCLPGTRTAVLDRVDQWITNPSGSRIFWISGVAGCGKSAVAATIAGRPRAIPTSIAVFYFVRGNQERNKRVLCSLSRQLVNFGHGSLEHFVLSSVKARPDIATEHLDTQFRHIILDPLKKLVPGLPPVILVVDALDEWNNHDAVSKLIDLIREAHTQLPPTIRFVLASRNEPHLVRSLDSASMRSLVTRYPLDAVLKTDAGRDIQRYIEKRFTKICSQSGIDTRVWPEARDVENLVLLSDGLFQWAATVMSYIEAMGPQGRLRNILKNPERYRGLDNLYRGVLEGSPEEEMDERVPRLLQNVLGAILTAPAARDAITIGYLCCDDLDTLEETMDLIQQEILPRLASMFVIPKDPTLPITISHKSVLDYLTTKDRCTDPRFYTDLSAHQERIIHSCFRRMGSKLKQDICGINDPSKLNKDVQNQVAAQIPLTLRYLCEHWVEHLATPGQGGFAASCNHFEQFSQNHVLHWLEVMSLIGQMERVVPMVLDVERWLSAFPSLSPVNRTTRQLWSDIPSFVTMFLDPISTAAVHIYISAIRLAPIETQLVRQYAITVEWGVRVTGGLEGLQWPPSTWTATGHTDSVLCTLFSPDGRTIISGSGDKTLRLWDAKTGITKGHALKGHMSDVYCASFSPDGETILSGSGDTTLRLWDTESGAPKDGALKGHSGEVLCASFSSNGKTILSGSGDETLRLWDAESGAEKGRTLEGHTGSVKCTSFSPDGKKILSGSDDGTLRLWDAESGTQKGGMLEGHTGTVECALFSPGGKTILSGSSDMTLQLWDAETGAQKGEPLKSHTNQVMSASFSPDGRTILSGSADKTLRLWDAESGAQKGRTLEGHTHMLWCAVFSPDGRSIVSGSADRTLRTWNADSGALRAEPQNGHTRGVSCFVFSPDGETIVSGSYDKTVRLWDAETGALKGEPLSAEGMVEEVSFSADGLTLIGKTFGGSSQEWDFTKYVPSKYDATLQIRVCKGSVSPEGWIFHRGIRWFWMPFYYADWLLCGDRLAVRNERVVYIIDVSEIMYIVE